MKSLISLPRLFVMLLALTVSCAAIAQTPTYKLYVTNEQAVSSSVYQFDVYLQRTGATPLELANFAMGLGFDVSIVNGGTLSGSIVGGSSELNSAQIPQSITIGSATQTYVVGGVTYRYFNVAARTNPGAGAGSIISHADAGCSARGTRIGTFRITNSVAFAQNSTCKHTFSTAVQSGRTNTVISAYIGTTATNVTVAASNLGYQDAGTCIQNIALNSCTAPSSVSASNDGPKCKGSSVNLSASASGTSLSYAWSGPGGFTSNTQNTSTTTAGTYTVTVSNSCGSASNSTVVGAFLTAPSSVSASNDGPKCTGSSVNLSSSASGSATLSYAWSGPGGFTANTQNTSTTTAGTYTVTVSNSCGSSSDNTVVAVNSSPSTPAAITGTTTLDAGTTTQLSDATNGGSWSSDNTAVATVNSSGLVSGVSAGTAVISYSVSNSCGSASAQTTVTVNAVSGCSASSAPLVPTALKQLTPTGNVCTGYIRSYTATAATTGEPATSYSWSVPSTVTGLIFGTNSSEGTSYTSTSNTIQIQFTGNFTAASVILSVKALNCFGQSATAKTLTIKKGAPATPAVLTPYLSPCPTDVRTYTATAVQGVTSYNWTLTGNATFTDNGLTSISSSTNTVSVSFASNWAGGTLALTESNSCATSIAKTLTLTQGSALPTAPAITVSGGIAKVCQGDVRTYSIRAITSATSYNYSITGAGALINGTSTSLNNTSALSISITYDNNFTAPCTLSVSANNGCGTGPAKVLVLARNVLPAPTLAMDGGLLKICPGDTKSFTATLSATATPATGYLWSVTGTAVDVDIAGSGGNNYVTAGPTASIVFNAFTGTSVKVSVQAVNACGNGTAKVLTVSRDNPAAFASTNTVTGAAFGDCATTKSYSIGAISSANPAHAMSYVWSFSAGPVPAASATISQGNAADNFASVTFGSPFTSATLKVQAQNACGINTGKTIALKGAPAAPTVPSGPTSVCKDNITEYTYSTTGATGATSFSWTPPAGATIVSGSQVDNFSTGSSSVNVTFGTAFVPASNKYVKVTAYTPCGSAYKNSLAITSLACRLAEDAVEGSAMNLSVFPNPASEATTVKFNAETSSDYKLTLVDLTGRVMMEKQGASVEGVNFIDLNLTALAKGVYMINLSSGDQNTTSRLVVVQ